MADRPLADVMRDEYEAIRLRKEDQLTFEEIAVKLGYRDRSGAFQCYMRGLRRMAKGSNLEDELAEQVAICDAMIEATLFKALEGDMDASKNLWKALERKAKTLGTDFEFGLAERQLQVNEQIAAVFMKGMEVAMTKLGMTDEQRALLPSVLEASLAEASS